MVIWWSPACHPFEPGRRLRPTCQSSVGSGLLLCCFGSSFRSIAGSLVQVPNLTAQKPVFAHRQAGGGETGRWWFGASRSKELKKGCKPQRWPRTTVETRPNDAGLALGFLSHDSTPFYGQGCAVRVRRKPGSPQPADLGPVHSNIPKGERQK